MKLAIRSLGGVHPDPAICLPQCSVAGAVAPAARAVVPTIAARHSAHPARSPRSGRRGSPLFERSGGSDA